MSEIEATFFPATIWILVTFLVIMSLLGWSITEPPSREFLRRFLTLGIFVISSAWMYNMSTYQPFFLGAVVLGTLVLLAEVLNYLLRRVWRR